MKVRLSLLANRDVSSILLYTEQHWGRQQRQRHRARLREGLTSIGENPLLGKRIESSPSGLRRYPIDEHIIFYRVQANFVEIVRILHHRLDVSNLLGE